MKKKHKKAPEILEKKGVYSDKVDLWSIGIMLYAMCTGSTPFQVTTMEQLMYNMRFQEIPEINRADISPELKDLIRKLLVKNPDQRISWEDFFNHPFLFSFDSIESRLQFLREVLDLASIKASNLDTLPDSLALHFKYLTSLFDLHKALSKLQVSFSHRDRHYFICTYLLSLLPPFHLLPSSLPPSFLPYFPFLFVSNRQ